MPTHRGSERMELHEMVLLAAMMHVYELPPQAVVRGCATMGC